MRVGGGGALDRGTEVGKGGVLSSTPVWPGLQGQGKGWDWILSSGSLGGFSAQEGSGRNKQAAGGQLGAAAAAQRGDSECRPGSGGVRGVGRREKEVSSQAQQAPCLRLCICTRTSSVNPSESNWPL